MYPSLNPGAEIWGPSRFWGTLACGYIGQTIAIVILFLLTPLYPQRLQRPTFLMEVTWLTPSHAPTKPPQPIAEAEIPSPALRVMRTRDVPVLQLPAVPPPVMIALRAANSPVLNAGVPRVPTLAPQRKLGTFSDQLGVASSAPPASRVQTGGFGDTDGLPRTGPGAGLLIAARIDSFDLLPGRDRAKAPAAQADCAAKLFRRGSRTAR